MNSQDNLAFTGLYREAFERCFGYTLKEPISEPDSRQFASEIQNKTGLTIGWKSLKNYSAFVLNLSADKKENPSVSTLDTLARYVLNAPESDEISRKDDQGLYSYWYQYREKYSKGRMKGIPAGRIWIGLTTILILSGLIFSIKLIWPKKNLDVGTFTDRFSEVNTDSLLSNGWMVRSVDFKAWKNRDTVPGCLTLFTLRGDNWPDSLNQPDIKNLMLRKIGAGCFTTEIHFRNFIPLENWQQAGILLLEDTSFTGKSLRFSLAYNDYTGGMPPVKTILLQVIFSSGSESIKPEELVQKTIFSPGHDSATFINQNLKNSALRIEKQGNRYRFLFSDGTYANSAFTEVSSKEIDFMPKYVGIFALKGFVKNSDAIPVHIDYFSISKSPCNK